MFGRWLVLFAGLTLMSCSSGDGSGTTGSTTGGATGSATGDTTGSTTAATEAPTTTIDPTVTTTGPSSAEGGQTTNGGPAPEVVCGELPPGVVGVAYSTLLAASGGMGEPYNWLMLGAPPWLSLTPSVDTDTAELSGVPEQAGLYMFTLQVFSNGVEDPAQPGCQLMITDAARADGPAL